MHTQRKVNKCVPAWPVFASLVPYSGAHVKRESTLSELITGIFIFIRRHRKIILALFLTAVLTRSGIYVHEYIHSRQIPAALPVTTEITSPLVSSAIAPGISAADESLLPDPINPDVLPYPSDAVYIDGKIADKAYEYGGENYMNISTFLGLLNIEASLAETETGIELSAPGFSLKCDTGSGYIVTNGRYQYVPNGLLFSPESSHGASAPENGPGGNIYLPESAVDKIFNVHTGEDDKGNICVDTSEMALIQGDEYYYDIHLDANIFYWLPHIINSETYGESLDSKLAVANVVLNRLKFDLFPDTIYGVIYDTQYAVQFSPVAIGGVKGTPDNLSYIAAFLAVEGFNNIDNCMYYVRPNASGKNTEWFERALVYYDTIGSHRFYYKNGNVIPDKPVMN